VNIFLFEILKGFFKKLKIFKFLKIFKKFFKPPFPKNSKNFLKIF